MLWHGGRDFFFSFFFSLLLLLLVLYALLRMGVQAVRTALSVVHWQLAVCWIVVSVVCCFAERFDFGGVVNPRVGIGNYAA